MGEDEIKSIDVTRVERPAERVRPFTDEREEEVLKSTESRHNK